MAPGTEDRKAVYDRRFFDEIRPGCRRSAEVAVPIVLEQLGFAPSSVVDVGAGEGWWLDQFAKLAPPKARDECGAFLAVDGFLPGPDAPELGRVVRDLTAPLGAKVGMPDGVTPDQWELAVTLEVAEHLPPERAEGFVADLCDLAPLVLFSAAMPGQGGTGHVNCQAPAWWANQFEAHGYLASGGLRWALWGELDVEPWYRSNLMLFAHHTHRITGTALFDDTPANRPLHVVAPDLWIDLPAGR